MKYVAVCMGVLLVSLWMVPAMSAAGDYYCSADVLAGGQGTAAEPWACVTVDQFNARVADVCRAGGGTLHFLFTGGYVTYAVNPDCSVTPSSPNPGRPDSDITIVDVPDSDITIVDIPDPSVPSPTTPPTAGGDLPLPSLVMLALLAAGGLIAAGMLLRRPHPPAS